MSGFRSGGFDDGGSSVNMFVAASDCGKIIGRGGNKIRELQEQTGCRIKVNRDDEGDGTRRVTLSGPDDAVDLAKRSIDDILESSNMGGGGQRQSYGGSSGGSREVIQIDTSFVGRVIGKGGSRIREMQDDTGCRINVSRGGGNYGQTDVELIGNRGAIQSAKDLIEEITSMGSY